ncbi:hypothetical protein [Nonlabens sp. YIK11]|uniref:hypothetical protein n=1 Tax=Nonlabens sp. YIK11 TaxID=1453349 RepID=UPI000AF3C48A|nr:hypothetical protein [Nonlabens sp. YIK11]
MKLSMSTKILTILLFAMFLLFSCSDTDDDIIIIDSGGSSEYFLNNQTNKRIIAIFQKSESLGLEIDTTDIVEINTSKEIFQDFMIGVNPMPTDSFNEIKFFEADDLDNPILILSPIQNQDWTLKTQDLNDSGYGLSTFEFTITN